MPMPTRMPGPNVDVTATPNQHLRGLDRGCDVPVPLIAAQTEVMDEHGVSACYENEDEKPSLLTHAAADR